MSLIAVHRFARVTLLLALACLVSRSTEAQVYRLAELRTDQIGALDREKTVILMPGGILEEHGPYLPSYADGYVSERLTADLAAAIAKRPGWAAVVFPVIPLGSGGANEIGGRYAYPGTYAVRPATLRAVFMDLATEFGEQGYSEVMALRPDLVPSTVTHAPSVTGKDFPDLMRIAAAEGWPGYFGAPRHASAELGRRLIEARHREYVSLALRILDGLDERGVARYAPMVWKAPGIATVMDASAKRDAAIEERQRQWLSRNEKR